MFTYTLFNYSLQHEAPVEKHRSSLGSWSNTKADLELFEFAIAVAQKNYLIYVTQVIVLTLFFPTQASSFKFQLMLDFIGAELAMLHDVDRCAVFQHSLGFVVASVFLGVRVEYKSRPRAS